ncbi:MAG: nicotinate phosphoribosyltransferase [Saezia sp.]
MIINSLLDTDLYKFTMMQAVLHQFPAARVEYKFKCRNKGVDLTPYVEEIRREIAHLCTLRFTEDELDYIGSWRYIKCDFVEFLRLFQLSERYIQVEPLPNGDIDIRIRGPWLHTILFEIPVLAIVNEVYFRNNYPDPDFAEGHRRLAAKLESVSGREFEGCKIADYGTRRRFSKAWQEQVLIQVKSRLNGQGAAKFVGTSNVHYAYKLGLTPLGTMAHEYLQACQALGPRLRDSQVFGFDSWAKEYRGDLGIALSDVYGLQPFLRDFDLFFCKLFDGARHDSGDPFEWGELMLEHYRKHRVDPYTKTLIFSDGLSFPRIIELYNMFNGRCDLSFGIGTNLTNDLGYEPLQIVLKMIRCNGQPVAKVSDTPGKSMCEDEGYLAYLRQVFDLPDPSTKSE